MIHWPQKKKREAELMLKQAHDDEEQLIARSQQGDVSAFNELVLHYQQIVYGTAYRVINNTEVAADITQDAFLAAFRSIQSYRGGTSFRAWLLRIVTNLAYDYWRRTQRRPTESLEILADEDELH